MTHRVCPWWLGYFLASPLRRLVYSPEDILAPHVHEDMTILEPGPGMGFFTIPLARLAGPRGRVVAVDIQPKMIAALERRVAKAGLADRVHARLAKAESMGIADLDGTVDFVLAFAVVHELPSADRFFEEAGRSMKHGGRMLLAEPSGHVKPELFDKELASAARAGLHVVERVTLRGSLTAVLEKA